MTGILLDIRLVLEVVAAAFAIRAFRHNPIKPLRLLRNGFLCLAGTHIFVLIFSGLSSFAFPQLRQFRWVYYADPIGVIIFLGLCVLSFQSMLRERAVDGTQKV
jgi:hypothetical protein